MFKDNNQKYNVITFILSVIFSLIGSEIILRLLDLGFNNGPLNPSKTSHHEHPYNFKFTSYSPQGEWDNILVEYDEFGNRVIEKNCELNSSEKNYDIVFLGDSFTENAQVNSSESFPGIVQNALCNEGAIIHNFGVSSYSPVLSYAHLIQQNEFNSKLKLVAGSKIIHFLFENDIENDNEYSKLISSVKIRNKNFLVVDSNQKFKKFHRNRYFFTMASRNSYLIRLIRRAQLTFSALSKTNIASKKGNITKFNFQTSTICEKSVKEMYQTKLFIKKINDFANSKNVEYIISAIPHNIERISNTNYGCFKKIASELNIKFIESPIVFFTNPGEFYFKKDIHLNSKGNSILANQIINYLKE